MYDLIIIGSGPAGLSAAVYAKRAGLNMLIIEKNPVSGGQIIDTYEVDNYLGIPGVNGFDLAMKFREHADKLGAEFADASVTAIETVDKGSDTKAPVYKVVTDNGEFETHTIILATGAHHSKLGIPGEEEFIGKGVSYCATCDGAFFKDKTVSVVGGGNTAFQDALYLSKFCHAVYLIHRRDSFRASAYLVSKVKSNSKIILRTNEVVEEIKGENMVNSLVLKNTVTSAPSAIDTSAVFIAAGRIPNSDFAKNILTLDKDGYILTDENMQTSVDGIYAVGDVRKTPLRQIITAAADGAVAANDISVKM